MWQETFYGTSLFDASQQFCDEAEAVLAEFTEVLEEIEVMFQAESFATNL